MAPSRTPGVSFKGGGSVLDRFLARPVRRFAQREESSSVAMLAATITALLWANVAPSSYDNFWHHPIVISIGSWDMHPLDLEHFVNEGLMAVFFFVVGLEIKRAVSKGGELNSVRSASLPAIAALGGMVVPALLYLMLNTGGEAARGWGIPMATDIAFAVGIVALLGSKVNPGLKLFLLTLAIVDDIGAIAVIAMFYSDSIEISWMLAAVGGLILLKVAQKLRVWWWPIYIAIGLVVWYCALESGIHATIAGVALGFMTPATALVSRDRAVQAAETLKENQTDAQLRDTALVMHQSIPLTHQLEDLLHPFTALIFVPAFALANAGVELGSGAFSEALTSSVSLGIILGLVVGKPLGIVGFTYVATRFGYVLPAGARWPQFTGLAMAAGIGFTVSIFVSTLAFTDEVVGHAAKVGILMASTVAAGVALFLLNQTNRHPLSSGGGWAEALAPAAPEPDFDGHAFIPPGSMPVLRDGVPASDRPEVTTSASRGVGRRLPAPGTAADEAAGDDAETPLVPGPGPAATRHQLLDKPPHPWRVLVIPGDDAAPEAMAATMTVLEGMHLPVVFHHIPAGVDLESMPVEDREELVSRQIDTCDTVLFGASNGTTPGAGLMRWGKLTYANVRPIRWRPGYRSPLADPSRVDYVIVRENLEDMYVGVMGNASDLLAAWPADRRARIPAGAQEGRYAAKIITRDGTERVARFACELALSRRGLLTVSAKTNMLPATDRFFCDITREVAQEYSGLTFQQFIVDDMAHRQVTRPEELDVLLLPNLYGDMLSDAGAGTIGGMGLAPSGCYGDDFAYFESAHGTAPDIAGTGTVNPTATLLSAVLMLRYIGLEENAQRLDDAITSVYATGQHLTPDQGGEGSANEFADAVLRALP